MTSEPVTLSVIVPFHRNLAHLRRCLAALNIAREAVRPSAVPEIIVVADGASEDPRTLVSEAGAALVTIDGPSGPAVARNRGAAAASGDVLIFVDSDVTVGEQALARFAELCAAQPQVSAAFGAYDEQPDDPGFVSQGKNLAHSFIHRRAPGEAYTFWGGLGAVRADVFKRVGGFDERFRRPSVEDIDLGYRIRAAGHRIVLDPSIQGRHLKRWTLRSALVSDVRDRGIPWTQLLRRYGGLHNHLNLTIRYRACVITAYALVICLTLAVRWPILLAAGAGAATALWWLDRPYYQFLTSRRGIMFTLAWFPLHIVHHLSNGVSFVAGTMLYASRRWVGLALPGALPLTPWSGFVMQPPTKRTR